MMRVTWYEPAGQTVCPVCDGDPQYICAECNASGDRARYIECRHVGAVPLYAAGGVALYMECGHQAHEIVEAT